MPKIRTDHSHVLLSCLYCFTNFQTLNCVLEDLHKTRSVKQNLLEVYLNGLYQTAFILIVFFLSCTIHWCHSWAMLSYRESPCVCISVFCRGVYATCIWIRISENKLQSAITATIKKYLKIQDTVECKPYLSVILESESTIKISCKESPENFLRGFEHQIQTHDLRDTGALLLQQVWSLIGSRSRASSIYINHMYRRYA